MERDAGDRLRPLDHQRDVQATGDPVYLLDEAGRFTFVNDRFVDVTGVDRDELIGDDVTTLLSAEDGKRTERAIRSLVQGEAERTSVEVALHTADGDRIRCEHHLAVVSDDGDFAGTVGMVRDVTDRTATIRDLEAQNRKIQSLHEAAQDIVASEDVDEVYHRTVRAAEQILDFELCCAIVYEDGMLVPKALSRGAPPDGARPMGPDEGNAGKVYQTGEVVITDDVTTDDTAMPAKDSYRSSIGVPIGDLGVFQAVETEVGAFDAKDVDFVELLVSYTAQVVERLRSEQALERKNERLSEFASVISHDLRNPLNVAAGHLEIVRIDPEEAHFDAIEDAHDRMETLLDDVLMLARMGERISDPEPVALADVFEHCWGTVRTAEATANVETDLTIVADRNRLQQLLENLVSNAIDHGGAAVTVTLGDLANGFYVADDGPGVPDDEQVKVFDTGYSTADGGTGFGLSIVRDIAEAHGWSVAMTDGADGGARIEVVGVETA